MNLLNNIKKEMPIGDLYRQNTFLNGVLSTNEEYLYYDTFLRYYTGLFNIKTKNKNLKRIWPIFMRNVVEFGQCAIIKKDGDYIVATVSNVKVNNDFSLKSATAHVINRTGYLFNEEMFKNSMVNVKEGDFCILRWNDLALPFLWMFSDFINKYITLNKSMMTSVKVSIKKIIRTVRHNSTEIDDLETKSMLDPDTPNINIIDDSRILSYKTMSEKGKESDVKKRMLGNQIEEMKSSGETALQLFEIMKEFLSHNFYLFGRRINTNKKKERNVSAEVSTEEFNFDAIENNWKRYVDIFKDDLIEMTGEKDIEIEFLYDEKEKEQEENENENNNERGGE